MLCFKKSPGLTSCRFSQPLSIRAGMENCLSWKPVLHPLSQAAGSPHPDLQALAGPSLLEQTPETQMAPVISRGRDERSGDAGAAPGFPPLLVCRGGRSLGMMGGGCSSPSQAMHPSLCRSPGRPPVVNLALVIHSVLCQQFKRALLVFFADFN